jgi:hypothetical protein
VLWRNLCHRERVDHDMDDELGAYLELVAAEKTRRGVPLAQAMRGWNLAVSSGSERTSGTSGWARSWTR